MLCRSSSPRTSTDSSTTWYFPPHALIEAPNSSERPARSQTYPPASKDGSTRRTRRRQGRSRRVGQAAAADGSSAVRRDHRAVKTGDRRALPGESFFQTSWRRRPPNPADHVIRTHVANEFGTPQEMELPDTEYPSEREARIAKRHNEMVNEMKFTPFWIDPPMRATTGACGALDCSHTALLRPPAALTDPNLAPNARRNRAVVRSIQTKNCQCSDGSGCAPDGPRSPTVRQGATSSFGVRGNL